jgi:putative DNA primase/helicase
VTNTEEFREAAATRGVLIPQQPETGRLSMCGTADKPRSKNGRYILHLDAWPAGGYMNMADGQEWKNWRAGKGDPMTIAEKNDRDKFIAEARLKAEKDRAIGYAAASMNAMRQFELAAEGPHLYLTRKGIRSHGTRVSKSGHLLIPLCQPGGVMSSLQRIDDNGGKQFLPGSQVKGASFRMMAGGGPLLLCEGFSTGATLREATGYPTICAMSCTNLMDVAKQLRKAFPVTRIVICADNDHRTEGNPGLTVARAVAAFVPNSVLCCPDGINGTDANDLQAEEGLEAVAGMVSAVLT